MTMFKRVMCLLLCLVTLASFAGCQKETAQSQSQQEQQIEQIPTTETYVVKNGVSPYKILIPANASAQIQFAASDFQFFFKEATGISLEITTQCDNVQGKYFSIGETAIKAAAGVVTTYDELNRGGYKVLTYGDAIVMAGYTDKASTYAVYGYLGKQFGLEIYANEVWEIRETTDAKLVDLNWTDIPDIAFRCGGICYSWFGTMEYMSRLRWDVMSENWGLVTHTYFTILPPAKYLADHPDWYDDPINPLEICKTNEEMKAQFIENMKQIILDKPDCIYFMMGQEDGGPKCNCQNCEAVRQQYNGSNSALMVLFTNEVVRELNAWAAEVCPDRVLEYVTFAYTTTEVPPVYMDNATGEYHPINDDEKLHLEHNLGVQIAPVGTAISVPYLEGSAAGTFMGWQAVADKIYLWAYSAPFGNFLVPFDGFGAFKQNYMDYVEMGVEYVFEQGFISGYAPSFYEMRGYVCSKLMWDTTLDTDTLVRNYMRAYYGPAWETMYEFYTLWRLRMTELQAYGMYSYVAAQHVQDWCQPELYPKTLLDQYEALFDKMLEKNAELAATDPELAEIYDTRIREERCMVWYLSLSIYPQYYDKETYAAMIDEYMELMGARPFNKSEGNPDIQAVVQPWLDNLNNM